MDAKQYNDCVSLYSDAVYRFALKSLKNVDDAKEIVQMSFEKLWNKKEKVEYERVKSYLFTMAQNSIIDFWRAAKRITDMTPEIENRPVETKSEYKGLKQIIEKALEKLPSVQKSCILLRDYEGYSYEEIGEITGLNESQVKVYIFRARQTMKIFIGSLEAVL